MALPDSIEIEPLRSGVAAEITVPGSKSITNRALILAVMGRGEVMLEGALWSEDTQVMVEGLKALGFQIAVQADSREVCNRTLRVHGTGGAVPAGGTVEKPLELFVGNAGTAARFLAPLVCLGRGFYRLRGTERMHERPQEALFDALRSLGYEVRSPNNRLPAIIAGSGPRPGRCRVSIEESSQFASGLLLCAPAGGWQVEVVGENAEESFYVAMTSRLIQDFPAKGGAFEIEPDASSGSYFVAAGHLLSGGAAGLKARIRVSRWPESGLQIDERFPAVIGSLLAPEGVAPAKGHSAGRREISRLRHLGDSIMTAMVLAPFGSEPIRFTDLGRLRVQECERVAAMRAELTRCGARVVEQGDTLEILPSPLKGAEIQTYNDHRMAMCFAILGLKVPGIKIQNPACVKKTFPDFFQKLAVAAPEGLGATIRRSAGGAVLAPAELFAD